MFLTLYITVIALIAGEVSNRRGKNSRKPSHDDILLSTAALEHECDLLPHSSADIAAVCEHRACVIARIPKPPKGSGGGSPLRKVYEREEKEEFQTWSAYKAELAKAKEEARELAKKTPDDELFSRALAAFKSYDGTSVPTEDFMQLPPSRSITPTEKDVINQMFRLGFTPNEIRARVLGYR